MHPDVRRLDALLPRNAALFGGKARGLAELVRAGFAVPSGFAISSQVARDAMARALDPRDRLESLITAPGREVTSERLSRIAREVEHVPLVAAHEEAIRAEVRALAEKGGKVLAVRSSSLREDQSERSGAGIFESVLAVSGEEAVIDAVRKVWASAFSARAIAYQRAIGARPRSLREGASERGAGIGVVVQALVPADAAGVLFTVHPLTGDASEIVVNATIGLGVPVVDGTVAPDTYRIDKHSGWLRDRVIGDKARVLRVDGAALREEVLADEARKAPALDEATLLELSSLAQRIEQTFGDARDVEWARVDRTLYVLQARPVTALPTAARRRPSRRPKDRARLVWSNVNVGEALPGVASPLTWSILSGFSDVGFRRAFGALGCSVPTDAELVGNFRGRIYLNLTEFFAIAAQVPGLSPRSILALGGGGELAALEASLDAESPSSAAFFARLPRTALRFARENFRLSARVESFEVWFERERGRIGSMDLRLLSSTAVHRLLFEVERLLDQSGQILLTAYGNLLASVVALRALVDLVVRDGAGRDGAAADVLFRDVLTGLVDVDSAGPGRELHRIAETARRDDAAYRFLLATPPDRARLVDVPHGPTRGLLERFFELYGERGTREAEIASPRWREDATLPFATLRLHLEREGYETAASVEQRQRQVREAAQGTLERAVPFPLRGALRRLVELVQRFVRLRERLRGHVVTVLDLFRSVALDASRRMRAMEPGVGDDGAFFLTLDELHGVLRGDVLSVGDLVRARRLQHARDVALPAPPDTFVGFPPPEGTPIEGEEELVGLGASAGRVEGIVRVVDSPADAATFRAGEILVAQQTDVGWSPLFLVAGGVVTELGGPLSHAAVVAREFGVPAVVNVKNAARLLRTGDRVALDGARGIVRRVASAPRPSERA